MVFLLQATIFSSSEQCGNYHQESANEKSIYYAEVREKPDFAFQK